jgi:hypothetical protein
MDLSYYFLIILGLAFLDNTLTHYQFFISQIKGTFNLKLEANPIARIIIGNNPNEYSFLRLSFYQISIIMLFLYADYYVYGSDMFSYGFFIGIFLIVNFYHITNIKIYKKNWNNILYWERAKDVIR